jgi:multidrug efflux pump
MAYAMMGGISVGTMLMLLFLPALYVAWFRIKEPEPATDNHREKPIATEFQPDLSSDGPCRHELETA